MQSKAITALVDANVFVSAFAFGGKPDLVVKALLKRAFSHVTSSSLLQEVEKTLIKKFNVTHHDVAPFLNEISAVSTLIVPPGLLVASGYAPDDLVLEAAILGSCNVLVTGDKRHLLPIGTFKGVTIESPSTFLKRFE